MQESLANLRGKKYRAKNKKIQSKGHEKERLAVTW